MYALLSPRLPQFEDFNSNDAFPLLATYRNKYLCYNDDIQGTASVCVAALMGAIKLRNPRETSLIAALRRETFLFHGAGIAKCTSYLVVCVERTSIPVAQLDILPARHTITA